MPEDEVGVVVKYFAKPGVAAVKVTQGSIKQGDLLRYKGHTTDFTEQVTPWKSTGSRLKRPRWVT